MRPMAKAPDPDRSLVRIAGALAVGIGGIGLLGYLLGFLFRGAVPVVLGYAHLGASILELSLALGIMRKRRAAWAFAVALEGTVVLICLLGLAQTLHAGGVGQMSTVVTVARLILLILLIREHKGFKEL